jgi:phenylpropionate dioxygenase-like ring-hydroxylating dioxygenase large terminal subunit
MSSQRIGDIAEVLLGYLETNKTFQTDRTATIPAESYTDPDQWRAEIDLIFKQVPLLLALTCELPKPGDYKAMEVVGLPVLIARDRAGTVRAFLNVCAHRWAPVAGQGLGNCAQFRFVCPFHGWTYSADGRLIGIADRAKFGEIDRATHGLKQLPCEERHGMIFVCLTPGNLLELDLYYGDLLREYQAFGLEEWTFLGTSELEGPNWKLIWANFFESYHFATQHPKTVALHWASNLTHYEAFGPNMRVGFALHNIAKLREVPRERWGDQEGQAFSFMRYLFPNVIGSMFTDISSFTQVFPGPTPDRSRVVALSIRREPLKDETDRKKVEEQLRVMTEIGNQTLRDEDFATAFAAQRGLRSGAHAGLLYGRNERGPQYFHEWVSWYLQANPNATRPVL